MKKHLFLIAALTSSACAQTVIDFEGLPLAPNSAYSSTASAPFQVSGVSFNHKHAFNLWVEGFAYTNRHDSSDGTFSNLYGVRAFKGYNQSEKYVVAQTAPVMKFAIPQTTVNGMHITNTTFAYKTIRDGSPPYSRKFGDTTGTGSGTSIPQGEYPDYFKIVVRGYLGGILKPDSVTFLLADYTGSNDYIVDDWQYMGTASLGGVDSMRFEFRSSDVGNFGINTPLYFAIDNLSITEPLVDGVAERSIDFYVSPLPFSDALTIAGEVTGDVRILDMHGAEILKAQPQGGTVGRLGALPSGLYVLEATVGGKPVRRQIIKE